MGNSFFAPQAPQPQQGLLGQPSITNTPRKNYLVGLLADAATATADYADKKDATGLYNPPVSMLSHLLGLPAIARTLDRISYGEPLTTGKGFTTKPRNDTVEAALSVAPIAAKYPAHTLAALLGPTAVADTGAAQAMAYLTRSELIEALRGQVAANKGLKLGLRVIPPEQGVLNVGDVVPPSFRWVNGNMTNRQLVGTSTAGLGRGTAEDIDRAITNLGLYENGPNGYYFGNDIALIGGDGANVGADVGERVIKNGKVLWKEENPRFAKK